MATNDNNLEEEFDVLLKACVQQSANLGACHHFDPDDATAYLERAMTGAALASFESHLASCNDCRRHLIAISRLMPQQAEPISTVIAPTPIKARLRDWFSGWRIGVVAGLGAATASALLLIVFVYRSPSELSPTMTVAQNKEDSAAALSTPLASVEGVKKQGINISPSASPLPNEPMAGEVSEWKGTSTTKAPEATAKDARGSGEIALSSEAAPPPPVPVPPVTTDKTEAERKEVLATPGAAASASAAQNQTNNFRGQIPNGPATNQMQAERSLELRKREAAQTSEPIAPASAPKPRAADEEKVAEKAKKDVADEADNKRPAAKPVMRAPEKQREVERPARIVGGKAFLQENGVWVDRAYTAGRHTAIIRLVRNSDEYKQTLKELPALKPYFDLNPVIVVWEGKVYRVENK